MLIYLTAFKNDLCLKKLFCVCVCLLGFFFFWGRVCLLWPPSSMSVFATLLRCTVQLSMDIDVQKTMNLLKTKYLRKVITQWYKFYFEWNSIVESTLYKTLSVIPWILGGGHKQILLSQIPVIWIWILKIIKFYKSSRIWKCGCLV